MLSQKFNKEISTKLHKKSQGRTFAEFIFYSFIQYTLFVSQINCVLESIVIREKRQCDFE